MDIDSLRKYIEERNSLTAVISKSIVNSISNKILDLPDEGLEELGECVLNACREIAETIISISEYWEEGEEEEEDEEEY